MPATITAGPISPPMASTAMRGLTSIRGAPCPRCRSGLGRNDLAAVIVAAGRAEIVRKLELTAVGALLEARRSQRVMAAAHIALRGRRFSLRDGHLGSSLNNLPTKLATLLALLIG